MIGVKKVYKLIYSIILYILLFMYIYSEKYVFLPVSTFWIPITISIIYALFYFKYCGINRTMLQIIVCGIVIFTVGFCSSNIFNSNGDLDIAKRGILMILDLFFGVLVTFLLRKSKEKFSLNTLIELLVNITIIQAFISIIFFLLPTVCESYLSIIEVRDVSGMEKMSAFRIIGVGDVRYATGAVQYGLIIWGIIALRHSRYGFYGNHKNVSYIVISLFTLLGIMSGRVFFVLFVVTILYLVALNKGRFILAAKEYLVTFVPTIILGGVAFIYLFSENEDLIKWAFEIFINLNDSGNLETASTNQLYDMYIFPETVKTWLIGDGKSVNENGGFYMLTDVGYIRSIFYWGVIGTSIFIAIQYILYSRFKKLCDSRALRTYVYFIYIWFLIYMFKDFYSIDKLVVLFLVVQSLCLKIHPNFGKIR